MNTPQLGPNEVVYDLSTTLARLSAAEEDDYVTVTMGNGQKIRMTMFYRDENGQPL